MSLIGLAMPPLARLSPPTITYRGRATSGANSTGYTFSARPIGPESETRLVVVAVVSHNNSGTAGKAPSGVTIGGDAMDSDGSTLGTGSNENGISFWRRVVATGTDADVVVSFSDGQVRCGIMVFTVEDYTSATPAADFGAVGSNNGSTTSLSVGVVTNARQAGIVVGGLRTGFGTPTCVFTNAIEATDFMLESGEGSACAGLIGPGFAGDVTANWTLAGSRAMRAVIWA